MEDDDHPPPAPRKRTDTEGSNPPPTMRKRTGTGSSNPPMQRKRRDTEDDLPSMESLHQEKAL